MTEYRRDRAPEVVTLPVTWRLPDAYQMAGSQAGNRHFKTSYGCWDNLSGHPRPPAPAGALQESTPSNFLHQLKTLPPPQYVKKQAKTQQQCRAHLKSRNLLDQYQHNNDQRKYHNRLSLKSLGSAGTSGCFGVCCFP